MCCGNTRKLVKQRTGKGIMTARRAEFVIDGLTRYVFGRIDRLSRNLSDIRLRRRHRCAAASRYNGCVITLAPSTAKPARILAPITRVVVRVSRDVQPTAKIV